MRLDLVVAQRFALSRRAARDAVRAGRVDVAGEVSDEPGADVPEDVPLRYDPNRPERRRVRSLLSVLAEDEHFLIVDKPAGLLSVQTAEHESDTLFSRALAYLQHRYRRRAWAGVVHRLDKDTSGALVFARTREALQALQAQFRAHRIEREYVALVEGDVERAGVFDAPLVRDRGDRRRGVARPGEPGLSAVTRYRPLERFGKATLVSVRLETGRTHQIRVHFSSAGWSVIGDAVYRRREGPPAAIAAPRQMLHARTLGFDHPGTGKPVRVESPIPADFAEVLEELRRREKLRKPSAAPDTRGVPAKKKPRVSSGR
ncbi:MAG: RluA family pseudouridine synthase [Acidobacteriota bacterium]|nr:RluA family pseudouridine synthase [Acidobacteriota bacterium]MDQ5872399.1 RluA family pseudouridine synthase [Acidobacteriota bacterium]